MNVIDILVRIEDLYQILVPIKILDHGFQFIYAGQRSFQGI